MTPWEDIPAPAATGVRAWIQRFVAGGLFHNVVVLFICLNAIVLGLETLPVGKENAALMMLMDQAFVVFFLCEIGLRLVAHGPSFFRSPWSVFDFLVVVASVLPHTTGVTAFRAFRILRVLRVVTVIPRMRLVVRGLLDAIPGILSVAVVAMLITYIFAVLAATWYGETNPEYFGGVFVSMYTLFQIITLEGWRDIADAVTAHHPNAWAFFIIFVLIGTFTMLNLFIAIVVRVVEEEAEETEELVKEETDLVLNEVKRLSDEVRKLSESIESMKENDAEPH